VSDEVTFSQPVRDEIHTVSPDNIYPGGRGHRKWMEQKKKLTQEAVGLLFPKRK
jgi:hypothetical protein